MSNNPLSYRQGFEAAMAVCAVADLEHASRSLVSCASRIEGHAGRLEITEDDRMRVRVAVSQARRALDAINKAVPAPKPVEVAA